VTDRVQPTIRPEDRLFHLILALMATQSGVSKENILHSVRGYREDHEAGVSKETLERRFERDKDILRDMGIPLETLVPVEDEGNNRNTLYRIPKGKYDHPEDLKLSAQDIRLLNVAAAVWREGSLSNDARVAQMKLASHGLRVNEPLLGALPMITARDPALASLRAAIANNKQVRFSYLKPGEHHATARQVSPLAVVMHEGSWHVLSLEGADHSQRTFLLRRIVSAVQILDDAAVAPPDSTVSQMTEELDHLYRHQVATVTVTPDSAAATILAHRPGTTIEGDVYFVHYTDVNVLADALCEHGPEVTVLGPPELVDAMVRQLTMLEADHAR
jgi:proteasome accessory factor B